MVQIIKPDARVAHKELAETMLEKLDEDNKFQKKLAFSDKAIFHISGKVKKQNVHIWRS